MSVNADSIPRYTEPTRDELNEQDQEQTCGDCCYCKDISKSQNGMTEYVAACIYEVYKAGAIADLLEADLVYVEPNWPACQDFKGSDED